MGNMQYIWLKKIDNLIFSTIQNPACDRYVRLCKNIKKRIEMVLQ